MGIADFRSQTDVDTGGALIAIGVFDAGLGFPLVREVFEIHPRRLESGRVGIRQIIGDDVDGLGQGEKPGRSGVKRDNGHLITYINRACVTNSNVRILIF